MQNASEIHWWCCRCRRLLLLLACRLLLLLLLLLHPSPNRRPLRMNLLRRISSSDLSIMRYFTHHRLWAGSRVLLLALWVDW